MPNLADLRAKLPDLEGLDDEQAISVIQQVYYPSTPVETIAARLGYKAPASAALPERSKLAAVNDTVIEAANAVAGGVGSIANFVAPGNRVSAFIDENIVKPGQESQSDRKKAINARLAEETASAQGIGDQVGAAVRYAKDDPAGLLGMAAGSFVTPMAAIKGAGMLAKALGAGAGTATTAALAGGAVAGGALSGGDAAGQAYEESKKAGATEEQAQAAARQASAIPAVIGAAGGMLGAERIFAGGKGFAGNAISRALKTGASEGAQEFGEEFATQYEANRAVAPFDGRDPMQGAVTAGTLGALAGAPIGGVTGALSPARAEAPKTPEQKAAKVLAAGSVDEAIKAAQEAVGGKAEPKPAGGGLDRLRGILPDEQRREVIGLMATAGNPNSPPNVRRFAEDRIDAILREYTDIPTADVVEETDLVPTPEVTELTDEQRDAYVNTPSFVDRFRMQRGIPVGETADAIPTGEASEVEPIPAGEATEEIPAPDAYEQLPTGEATEVIPTGDATEVPRIPVGKATEIEPEVIDGDLLTGDGMPYGSKTAANVRARREGLGPANVVEIPGAGWVVRPQPKTMGPAPISAQPAGTRGTNAGDVVKAPAREVVPAGLRVTFGGKTYPVDSIADAQEKWIRFRDTAGAGVSQVGNGVRVTDGAGRFVARISYNGRAWDGEDTRAGGGKVIAEAPEYLKAPDGPNPSGTAGPRPADPGRSDGAGRVRDEQPGDVPASAGVPAGQGVDGGGAAGPGGRDGALTPVRTRFGNTVYVREADLSGDRDRMRSFTSTGKSLGVIVRDNLDPTGEKRAADNAETADNPLFDVVTAKNGAVFASEGAAARERSVRGLKDSHDIVPSGPGFVLRRKATPNAAAPAEKAPAQARVPEAAAPTLADKIKQRRGEKAAPAPEPAPSPLAEKIKQRKDKRTLQEKVERPAADGEVVASVGDHEADGERKFYVTMVRGDRVARLAGPFDTKDEAEAIKSRAQDEANKADPRSAFDAFGVSGITSKDHKPGVLNDRLGIGAAQALTTPNERHEAAKRSVAERRAADAPQAAPAPQPEVDAAPAAEPAAEAPAPVRDERTIELRKRASVLRSLRECLG